MKNERELIVFDEVATLRMRVKDRLDGLMRLIHATRRHFQIESRRALHHGGVGEIWYENSLHADDRKYAMQCLLVAQTNIDLAYKFCARVLVQVLKNKCRQCAQGRIHSDEASVLERLMAFVDELTTLGQMEGAVEALLGAQEALQKEDHQEMIQNLYDLVPVCEEPPPSATAGSTHEL